MKLILLLFIYMTLKIFNPDSRTLSNSNKLLPAQTIRNIHYGPDTAQCMDIYLPEGRNTDKTKILVLIHGGGWNGGNKSDFSSYIDSLKLRMPEYAIFNINYRLVNSQTLFPAQENDIRSALNFIVSKDDDYQVNKTKVVLLGASAGAHLALLQAYKYNDPKISAVVDFFGPSDLISMYTHPWHPLVKYALQMVT
ncbi:MAG TPA: alpha/beta hydrolase, partial [Flavisolibacter sp.]|nr:alpha/beta hydrolase [Flavisolibacter sp.]